MNRREALQSLAALASARWAAEGLDPEMAGEDWDRIDGSAGYTVDEFTPDGMILSADSYMSTFVMDRDWIQERHLGVYYDSRGVNLDVEGSGEEWVRAGSLTWLSAEQAREVAVALFMAAEEQERRTEGQA